MKRLIILSLAIFLSCGVCSAYSMGYFDKDDAPKPPVVVPDPPPAQTVTTEYGDRKVYNNEVDFYFVKPIAAYGKFNLTIAGKKYTVQTSYKDTAIEVRNSQSTGKLVVIAGASYKDKSATVTYPSTDALTKPDTTPPPVVTPPADGIIDTTWQERLHHYNPKSLVDSAHPNGQGVALLFCRNERYESVTFNGTAFRLQNIDEGRDWWTNVDFKGSKPTNMSGTVIAKHKNGKTYRFNIPAGGKSYLDYKGDCFGK